MCLLIPPTPEPRCAEMADFAILGATGRRELREGEEISNSAWSLESNSLLLIMERKKQISPINKVVDASEKCSEHSGETSNSSGTNATSHLTGFIPENESFGAVTAEVDPINAAASR